MAGIKDIRKGLTGTLSKFIVGSIIVTFSLFFGWGTVFSSSEVNQVASVNETTLDVFDLDFEMRNQRYFLNQRFEGQDLEIEEELIRELSLESIIRRALVLDYLENQGIEISDRLAYLQIAKDENFLLDGKFSKQRFESVVRSLGHMPNKYLQRIKEDILLEHWQKGVGQSLFITEKEILRILELTSQTRDVTFLKLEIEDFRKDIIPTDEQSREYYENNKMLFQNKQKANIKFIELSKEKIRNINSIDEEELKKEYQAYLGDFDTTVRRAASHLMIKVTNDRQQQDALSLIEGLRQRIVSGEDFSSVVMEFSEDEGTRNNGGDLGVSDGSNFPPEFEEALQDLAVNEVSMPVLLEGSIHLLKLTNLQEPIPESFDKIKTRLKEGLEENFISLQFTDLLERSSDLVFSMDSLEIIGESLNIPIEETGIMELDSFQQPINSSKVLGQIINDENIQLGALSEVIELSEDQAVIFQVDEFIDKKIQPFEEVTELVERSLVNMKSKELLNKKAVEFMTRIEAGETLSQLAKEGNFESDSYKSITRDSSLLTRPVLQDLFDIPRSNQGKVIASDLPSGDKVLLKFTRINDEENNLSETEINTFKDFLFEERKVSELSILQNSLKENASIVRKNLSGS